MGKRMRKRPKADQLHAVTALVFNPKLDILAVGRREDPTDIGLPGGTIEDGELPADAMRRELREETGLVATHFRRVFDGEHHGRRVATYLVSGYEGRIRSSDEGDTRWMSLREFMQQTRTFRRYHFALFEHMGMLLWPT